MEWSLQDFCDIFGPNSGVLKSPEEQGKSPSEIWDLPKFTFCFFFVCSSGHCIEGCGKLLDKKSTAVGFEKKENI